jgi:ABC-type uncharacterized transport system substrate-binding protein
MRYTLERLSFGLGLIVLASAVLLLADLPRRQSGAVPQARWHVVILAYNTMVEAEESEAGIRDGFRDAGLVAGRDITIETLNAQGDMAALPTLVDAAVSKGADLLMPLSTPTLQATLKRAGSRPVVFSLVASPSAAGAGPSLDDHLPHVTGVATASAYREVIELIREMLPQARRIGTLYVPSEANSVYNREQVLREAARAGLEVESVAVSSSSEVADAALALTSRRLDAVCQVASNLTTASFTAIARAAGRNRVPVFGFMGSNLRDGAVAVVSRDYYDGGRQAAALAVRVLRGEQPAALPIQPLATTRLLLDQKAADGLGLAIPEAVRRRAAAGERH